MAYILGRWGFRGLDLDVDPRVLVPRPETELVVDRCLALLDGVPEPVDPRRRHRVGGDRAALASELAGAVVCGCDVSDGRARGRAGETARGSGSAVEWVVSGSPGRRARRPPVPPRRLEPALRRGGRDGGARARGARLGAARRHGRGRHRPRGGRAARAAAARRRSSPAARSCSRSGAGQAGASWR